MENLNVARLRTLATPCDFYRAHVTSVGPPVLAIEELAAIGHAGSQSTAIQAERPQGTGCRIGSSEAATRNALQQVSPRVAMPRPAHFGSTP